MLLAAVIISCRLDVLVIMLACPMNCSKLWFKIKDISNIILVYYILSTHTCDPLSSELPTPLNENVMRHQYQHVHNL